MIDKYLSFRVLAILIVLAIPAALPAFQQDDSVFLFEGEGAQENGQSNILIQDIVDEAVAIRLFENANELFRENRFEEAIQLYEHILASGYHAGNLYYNLGNAYYRSNKIPSAILNYERALLLAPGDNDVRFNLELARMHVRDRIEILPDFFLNRWWKDARSLMGANAWARLSIISFIITLLLASLYLMSATMVIKKAGFYLAILTFIVSTFSFAFGLDQRNHVRNHGGAIVFSPAVQVKSSPDATSTDLFVIHEGTRVWVVDSIGDWHSVRLSDGNQGWLRKDAIEMI